MEKAQYLKLTLEIDFQNQIIELAELSGWEVYHTYDSRRCVPGFPDLVLVRERVLWRELKTEVGRVSKEQRKWLKALLAAGADAGVWRPRDWPEIERVLTAKVPA